MAQTEPRQLLLAVGALAIGGVAFLLLRRFART
jgi:hypothetical protein